MRPIALLVLTTLIIPFCSYANDTYSYPGGVAQLRIAKESTDIPEAKFGLSDPVVIEYADHWRILIGLSLETLPGDYVVYIKPGFEGASGAYEKVVVKQHVYPFSEHPEFDAEISAYAVRKSHESFSDIEFSNTQQPTLPLRWPLEGSWSNNFGHTLYDQKRDYLHTPNAIVIGTNKVNTVVAPQTAIVTKIETSNLGVSTVFLDHGRGLYSILSGLSDLTVEPGNGIVSGAVIGKLAATKNGALASSPAAASRLIWQTVLNGSYVDPRILVELEP